MKKNESTRDYDCGNRRNPLGLRRQPARSFAWRAGVALVLLFGWAAATWLTTNCAGADQQPPASTQQRRRPRPPTEPPPLPTNAARPIQWEAGPWWQGQPAGHAAVTITNAGVHGIILGPTVTSTPSLLTVQSLDLGAPASDPLTLAVVKLGTNDPLHVLGPCTVHSNTAIRVDNAALAVDGSALIGGRLYLGRGSVTANSGLLVGEGPDAVAAVSVTGGILTVTNAGHTARMVVGASGKGTFTLNGGILQADSLEVTGDPDSRFIFKDGSASLQSISVLNGAPVTLGDGVHPVTLELRGGTNLLSAPLIVSSNATLRGSGTLCGPVVNYGTILAGTDGDTLVFASAGPYVSSVTNWGGMYMTNGGKLSFQGTVKNNATFPITAMDQTSKGLTLQLVSVGGLTHSLQYTSTLEDANWKTVVSVTGTGETISLTDPNPAGQPRYYRIYVGR